MAKKETFTCDFCTEPGTFTMTLADRDLKVDIKQTDLCEKHFKLLRSYIRHGCPPVNILPLDDDDGK